MRSGIGIAERAFVNHTVTHNGRRMEDGGPEGHGTCRSGQEQIATMVAGDEVTGAVVERAGW